ncbi:MAG: alpha-amylase family protein, partial [Pseudonocardiaceae bacterium]
AVVRFAFGIEVESGGEEVPGTMGGLAYRNTDRSQVVGFVPGSLEHITAGPEESYVFDTDASDCRVRCTIGFREEHPRVELRVAVSPAAPNAEPLLRDVHVRVDLPCEGDWHVEAPGNKLRPGVRVADVREPISIDSAAHELGSPGLVALHRNDLTLILWPLSRSESADITLEALEEGLRWHLRTDLKGAVPSGEWLEHGPVYLDLLEEPWSRLRREIAGWYGSVGLTTPADRADWAAAANIFEVMVGAAPFHGGVEYRPYPTMRDLMADLDRIADLGFDCLQLMPRHPYPSYNIHEPGDVSTTYGDPDEVRELVDACHDRGMRIVLDILLHGVLDKASIRRAVDVVQQGPHAANLDDPCADPYILASTEISWCRHILAFAAHWIDGSPDRHPLLDEHPEWF